VVEVRSRRRAPRRHANPFSEALGLCLASNAHRADLARARRSFRPGMPGGTVHPLLANPLILRQAALTFAPATVWCMLLFSRVVMGCAAILTSLIGMSALLDFAAPEASEEAAFYLAYGVLTFGFRCARRVGGSRSGLMRGRGYLDAGSAQTCRQVGRKCP